MASDIISTMTTTTTPGPAVTTDPRLSDGDDGDHDRFAHYCKKADITRAMVTGEPVTALCGKRWVPSRDPERYPICTTCKEILAARS